MRRRVEIPQRMLPFMKSGAGVMEAIPVNVPLGDDDCPDIGGLTDALLGKFIVEEPYACKEDSIRKFMRPRTTQAGSIWYEGAANGIDIASIVLNGEALLPRPFYESKASPPVGSGKWDGDLDEWCSEYVEGMVD